MRLRLRRRRREAQQSRGNSNAWLITAMIIAEERGVPRETVTAEYRVRRAHVMAFAIKRHVSIRVAYYICDRADQWKQDPYTWEQYRIDSCVAALTKNRKKS